MPVLDFRDMLEAAEEMAAAKPTDAAKLHAAAKSAMAACDALANALAAAAGVTVTTWGHWDDNEACFSPGSPILARYDQLGG